MSMPDIPQEYTIHLDPVNMAGGLMLDLGLDDVKVGLGPIHLEPVTVDMGLEKVGIHLDPVQLAPVKVDLGLDDIDICLNVAITQVPRVRVHVPSKYDFGFCLFGIRLFSFTFAGETMVETEDNPQRIYHHPTRQHMPFRSVENTEPILKRTIEGEDVVAHT